MSTKRPPKLTSPVVKRSICFGNIKTSVSLEDPFWNLLKRVASIKGIKLYQLVAEVDQIRRAHGQANLSSALRLYGVDYLATEAGLSEITTEMTHG